ncbi:hypothetical protein NQ315_013130 [Exocentrus adspersus]|uniref:MORN repeat-containing protein 3 n=1 Tax=Exocentrus adspersus TaxID=1586481 RepID=A0AAV8VWL8_9CUCU|nr:hypothetical protein NQ315_013130 [Exocentrus adspersus]
MPFYKKHNTSLSRSKAFEKKTHKYGFRNTIFNTVGDRYKGDWKEDKKSGKGVLLTRTNELYEGDFDRNYRHGFGVLCNQIPNTKVFTMAYRGSWKNGWPEGNGLRVYKDGGYYLGHWKRGKRHGRGQMWYADKSWYDGEWVDDMRQGLGVFVRADGNRYEGSWYKDKKHGQGRFFFLMTGQIQDGVWKEDYCKFSVMCDVPFRQTAIRPSVYPMPFCYLINRESICNTQQLRVLLGVPNSCLFETSEDSVTSSKVLIKEL